MVSSVELYPPSSTVGKASNFPLSPSLVSLSLASPSRLPPTPAGPTLVLEVISGPATGSKFTLRVDSGQPDCTIGRVKSNDLQLNDGEVSSKHAIVRWNDKVTRGQGWPAVHKIVLDLNPPRTWGGVLGKRGVL